MFKLACQTIIYNGVEEDIEKIYKHIADCGYEAVETGAKIFEDHGIEKVKELFNANNLKLAAIHTGGDFITEEGHKFQLEKTKSIIEYAKAMDCKMVYCSGTFKDDRSDEEFLSEASILDKLGAMCRENGIDFCYHNHWWEFENDWKGFRFLINNTDPENVKLVPDVGWLTVSNVEPVDFIDKYFDRIKALHFKDFKGFKVFCDIGTGIVEFEKVVKYYKDRNADNLWVSAEQDKSDDCWTSNMSNAKYVKSIF